MTAWRCLTAGCDAHGTGTWAAVDKAAEQHSKALGHGTIVTTVGSIRRRDETGRASDHKPVTTP